MQALHISGTVNFIPVKQSVLYLSPPPPPPPPPPPRTSTSMNHIVVRWLGKTPAKHLSVGETGVAAPPRILLLALHCFVSCLSCRLYYIFSCGIDDIIIYDKQRGRRFSRQKGCREKMVECALRIAYIHCRYTRYIRYTWYATSKENIVTW